MGIHTVDKRREVDKVDPCGIPSSSRAEHVDIVAGTSGEAEDAGRGHEEADAAERWEGGRGVFVHIDVLL